MQEAFQMEPLDLILQQNVLGKRNRKQKTSSLRYFGQKIAQAWAKYQRRDELEPRAHHLRHVWNFFPEKLSKLTSDEACMFKTFGFEQKRNPDSPK